MIRSVTVVVGGALLVLATGGPAVAERSVADLLGRTPTPEGQPKTLLEELTLFGYIENSYVWNLGRSRGDINELRFYDVDREYTFNAFELSLKKDASERYPLGFGVVVTAGDDSKKNHALGMFRDADDRPPYYRETIPFDLPEAYVTYRVPIGNGLTVKAGKWATPIGYEVYESPKNLNFSRSFLYTLGTPYTHTGLTVTYPFTSWFSATAGVTNGWDNADNNNGHLRPIGTFALTPTDTLSFTTSYLFGVEQNRNQLGGRGGHWRWIVDNTLLYTGIDKLTLAINFDIAGEDNEPNLVATGRRNRTAHWGGVAGYAAYGWTKALRTALRLEYFSDADGPRNAIRPAGQKLDLYEVTATLEYRIWRGLVGRVEYRHDRASEKAFGVGRADLAPTANTQNTIAFAFYYAFF